MPLNIEQLASSCRSIGNDVQLLLQRRIPITELLGKLKSFLRHLDDEGQAANALHDELFKSWEILEVTYALAEAEGRSQFSDPEIAAIDAECRKIASLLDSRLAVLGAVVGGGS